MANTKKKKTNNKKNNNTKITKESIKKDFKEVHEEIKEDINEEIDAISNKKTFFIFLGILALMFILIILINACSKEGGVNYTIDDVDGKTVYIIEQGKYEQVEEETNMIAIEVRNKGLIIAELYPETAPITVENYKKLVKNKFYDGLTFHRVIKDFMIQTGDPTATGTGGSNEKIKGEFEINGVENPLEHKRGVLSMARAGNDPETEATMNSASSQFFIVQKDSPHLNGKYAAFGEVIKGMDVVDSIAVEATDANDKPINTVTINTIRFVKEYNQ